MKTAASRKTMMRNARLPQQAGLVAIFTVLIVSGLVAGPPADDPQPRVESDFSRAAPRKVEDLTERSVSRDYRNAWQYLDQALSSNSPWLLDTYMVGPARDALAAKIAGQEQAGIRCRYQNQRHKLEAVFYSPEGDVMELHDTAEFDLQVLADGKTLHSEHTVVRYVVLMTPAADRWVVRQLQSVPEF
jgi:hypothetical protein